MADFDMTTEQREEFLADLHVGILSIQRDGKGPLALPIWYRYDEGQVVIHMGRDSVKAKLLELPDEVTRMPSTPSESAGRRARISWGFVAVSRSS